MFKDIRNAVCLGILLCVTVFLISSTYLGNVVPPEPQHRSQYQTDDGTRPDSLKASENLWQKTTSDPLAFFTFCLMIFTAVLAAATLGLWVVTKAASVNSRAT